MNIQKPIKALAKQYGFKLFVICFWLLAWELLNRAIGNKLIFVSPLAVFGALFEMVQSLEFWETILVSSLRILLGLVLALVVGLILAVGSYRFRLIEELFSPIMKMIKAMPVASFIILTLTWMHPLNLSVLISFMMVVPMIYSNVIQGLIATDEKLLQMAKVFRVGPIKKIVAIYIPSVAPYYLTAVSVGIGFCWKAGIAAEVIGMSPGSIGRGLYEAKLYLMTKELFAWTVVIILISVLFEKAVLLMLRLLHTERRL